MTLACSVGLVDHWLHDSPPGVDEPVEEISSDVEVRVANSQTIYGTPEIIFEVEDSGSGGVFNTTQVFLFQIQWDNPTAKCVRRLAKTIFGCAR